LRSFFVTAAYWKKMFISMCGTKKRTKEKAPSSLAFGSPRKALYRGGGKNSLRSNNSRLHPLSSASLGCAATGFKTLTNKKD
jgi:hypothetical protein